MIYVDSNVPMYLVGAAHANKQRVVQLLPRRVASHDPLVTSAETFQEIVHRYLALRDRLHLNAAYDALEAMVERVSDVTKLDVDAARALTAVHAGLSSRDCLHVAIMLRLGCTKIWSYDDGFERVPSLLRVG